MLSRKLPCPCSAISRKASSSIAICSASAIARKCATTSASPISRKLNRCTRLKIVAGSLSASVVARIKTTCSGGSSSVLRSALNADLLSICTSSMMYTFFGALTGAICTLSRKSRISSTELLLAASISIISRCVDSSVYGKLLISCAKIRAIDVLPTPRGPVSRYACATAPRFSARSNSRVMCACPTISLNFFERYFRYNAWLI